LTVAQRKGTAAGGADGDRCGRVIR